MARTRSAWGPLPGKGRQSANQDIGFIVLKEKRNPRENEMTSSAGMPFSRASPRDRERSEAAMPILALLDIERDRDHGEPQQAELSARGVESGGDALGILAAGLGHGGLTAAAAADQPRISLIMSPALKPQATASSVPAASRAGVPFLGHRCDDAGHRPRDLLGEWVPGFAEPQL